ncbi:hypothetical protein ACIPSA_11375 [Streptomyces sp. NPDC086549]|uniref:hypothetical protein n=1 Tax=Streptomyces sp. NPDC086549 TaxID=3365752 RepID=UPI003801845C
MSAVRTWSDSPFRTTVERGAVRSAKVLATDNGESTQVYEIADHPGWLAKLYRRPLTDAAAHTLQRLVYLPTTMSEHDRSVVDTRISWPVARICDGPHVVGVVMAKAPERFYKRLLSFDQRLRDPEPLPLDWLVHSDEACVKRGIRPADMSVRTRAMLELLEVGAIFARHDIVYADWSYINAFWEEGTGAVFVIDMDTSGIGTRRWIETMWWEDPLYPDATKPALTVYSDRYKLAMLTVRCLTGQRKDVLAAHGTLLQRFGRSPFHEAVGRALHATEPAARPSPDELFAALGPHLLNGSPRTEPVQAAPGDNVVAEVPVSGRTHRRPTPPTPPEPSGPSEPRVNPRPAAPRKPSAHPRPAPRRDPSAQPAPRPQSRPAAPARPANRPPARTSGSGSGLSTTTITVLAVICVVIILMIIGR